MDLMLDLLLGNGAQESEDGFKWEPCTYKLHAETGQAWQESPKSARLAVSMERPPIVSTDSHAWVWHKNCVIPRLTVTCAVEGIPHESLACLLSAVRVEVGTHAAHDVGLDGDTLRPLVHGSCSFSSLSFKTTSYNLKGKPLHLMPTLLVRSEHGLCVACSLISPPIIVNARKRQAKEKASGKPSSSELSGSASGETGLLPFAPDLLERKMEKVRRARGAGPSAKGGADDGGAVEGHAPHTWDAASGGRGGAGHGHVPRGSRGERASDQCSPWLLAAPRPQVEKVEDSPLRRQIDNSMEGLRNYLSALNIRNKCKHPLFLAFRFNACVSLHYDTSRAHSPLEDDGAFYTMMEVRHAAVAPTVTLARTPSSPLWS